MAGNVSGEALFSPVLAGGGSVLSGVGVFFAAYNKNKYVV